MSINNCLIFYDEFLDEIFTYMEVDGEPFISRDGIKYMPMFPMMDKEYFESNFVKIDTFDNPPWDESLLQYNN